MSRDDSRPPNSNLNSDKDNIFIRFKHRVDSNIAAGLDSIFTNTRKTTPSEQPSTFPAPSSPSPSDRTMADANRDKEVAPVDVYDISSTSYNPAALRGLPQPIPNDLPPHLDSTVFTFQDAFEDLVAVSNGHGLPDIRSRYEQSKILRQMYPNGEPTFLWLRRLESQGLASRPRGFRIFVPPKSDWDQFERDVEKGAQEFWDNIVKDAKESPANREVFEKAGRVFKKFNEEFSDSSSGPEQKADSQGKAQNRQGPDTFDDLYSSIKSTFAETQKTWDTFKKVMTEDIPARAEEFDRDVRKRAEEFKQQQEERRSKYGKDGETEMKEEYVDRFGYKHTTVTRKTFDKDGKETGSSVEVSIRPAEKKGGENSAVLDNQRKPSGSDDESGKKKGWLWKRGD